MRKRAKESGSKINTRLEEPTIEIRDNSCGVVDDDDDETNGIEQLNREFFAPMVECVGLNKKTKAHTSLDEGKAKEKQHFVQVANDTHCVCASAFDVVL